MAYARRGDFGSSARSLAKHLHRRVEHHAADKLGAPLRHLLRRCLVAAQSCLHNSAVLFGVLLGDLPCAFAPSLS